MRRAGKLFLLGYRCLAGLIVGAAAAVLLLLLFGVRLYAVQTGSMEPTIPAGSVCFVNRRVSFGEIRAGDIIAYRVGELLVTHRAVRVEAEGVTTKGDANNTEDTAGKVTEANFIGKTVFWIPEIGKLLLYVRTPSGRCAAIAVLVAFTALGLLYDRIKAKLQ